MRRERPGIVAPRRACEDGGAVADPRPPVPKLPGGPDPAEPVPRTPVDGIDLATYARVGVRLAMRTGPRDATLAAEGLTEARWLSIETQWLLRIAVALLKEDVALGREYEEAVAAAQAALAPAEPARSMEDYAVMVAAIEGGQDPAAVLGAAKMSAGEWGNLQRAWTERLARDPALTRAFRAMVAAARAAP